MELMKKGKQKPDIWNSEWTRAKSLQSQNGLEVTGL